MISTTPSQPTTPLSTLDTKQESIYIPSPEPDSDVMPMSQSHLTRSQGQSRESHDRTSSQDLARTDQGFNHFSSGQVLYRAPSAFRATFISISEVFSSCMQHVYTRIYTQFCMYTAWILVYEDHEF